MNNQDNSRYNLVTKFICAKCGEQLTMSYSAPAAKATGYNRDAEDGITGALKVENRIAIHPCRKCYSDAVAPMDAMRKALAAVQAESP